MPPKKDKNPEDKPGKKDDKKNKKKLANKRLGMGGTIGLSEKPVKKCMLVFFLQEIINLQVLDFLILEFTIK